SSRRHHRWHSGWQTGGMIEEQALPAESLFGQVVLVDLLVFFGQRSLLRLPVRLVWIEPQILARQARRDGAPLTFPVRIFSVLRFGVTHRQCQRGGQRKQRKRASIHHGHLPSFISSCANGLPDRRIRDLDAAGEAYPAHLEKGTMIIGGI